ncbi:MAG TPA: hypothetical protein VGD71_06540 [Kribbella sp.]
MKHDTSHERFTMASIGRLLTEEQGRLTVRRVLWVDNGPAKVETTFETEGSLRDVPYITLGTIQSAIRPDGTLHGDLKGGLRTDGNDTGVYRGITGGTYTEGTPQPPRAHVPRRNHPRERGRRVCGAQQRARGVRAGHRRRRQVQPPHLGAGMSIPEARIEPGRTAIVAVDFQNDIVGAD